MDLPVGNKRKGVGELLTRLLSRDPVEFNSAINSYFAANVQYSGHLLKFEGASKLKHAAYFFNVLVGGQPATFELKDIEWSEETNSAVVHTTRHVRPRFFPLFGLAVPVETRLRFHADGAEAGASISHTKLYVTKFEDVWPSDQVFQSLPVLGNFLSALFSPVLTFVVLAMANIIFAVNAGLTSRQQQLDSKVRKTLPSELTKNVSSGFQEGQKLAEGWGSTFVRLANRVTYPFLATAEFGLQRATSLIPLPLPHPYIYDAHSLPPGRAAKKAYGDKKFPVPIAASSKAPAVGKPSSQAISSPPSQDRGTLGGDEKVAVVEVGPALDGGDQGKRVDIPHRMNNESKDAPAAVAQPALKNTSLYDQLRKDGELPQQEAPDKLSLPGQKQTNASSSEEDHTTHGNNGSSLPRKKQSGSKKKKGGIVHTHPPSFKEGLQQAEEHDHQAQAS